MLLIGVGLLGTLPNDGLAGRPAGALATVLGKLLAYLVLEAVVLPFYLIVLPYLYDIPRLGGPLIIFAVSLPFVLSVSALGMVVAALFRSPLTVQLVFAAIGIPSCFSLAFLADRGDAESAAISGALVPSSSAINGIVSVSQLGAPLSDVRTPFLTLWALALFYGCLAVGLEVRMRRSHH